MLTIKERDRILLYGTIDEQYRMFTEATRFRPSCDEVVNRAVNKAITAIPYFPDDRRQQAREWLEAHGSKAWG